MHRLLLVSTLAMNPRMALFDSKQELKSEKQKNNLASKKEVILCMHCKRTSSNRVRCLGMCVADSEY